MQFVRVLYSTYLPRSVMNAQSVTNSRSVTNLQNVASYFAMLKLPNTIICLAYRSAITLLPLSCIPKWGMKPEVIVAS